MVIGGFKGGSGVKGESGFFFGVWVCGSIVVFGFVFVWFGSSGEGRG